MTYSKADLDMANEHVALAEEHIGRQERLILRLSGLELPTEEAERLLEMFHHSLRLHRDHRDAIEKSVRMASVSRNQGPLVR